ncbi:type IX secretion system membrane protein PorP/SprF [Flavobacterium alkalisoli]|uniref:Type IX secretion system membrane protein PorP/SprF n=1 Tax=Flavobacterium alkalisoli TaxID=2602769 RepID=A0A5B9G065_9FLAO|nr:type IX secretion system membrane protein PorP/SprF [Flavobacterium alkalisoli]QEE50672.1 type IX secretion system membrane protein PorP/SprF [Flavobacterium alkalisoli]
MIYKIKQILTLFILFIVSQAYSQQDPQYTQYMYNTLSVNPAYAGSLGHFTLTGIYRSQWVGIDGAPVTQTLSMDSPVGKNVGLGLSFLNESIGPSEEQWLNANFSYTIKTSETMNLSFGVNAGGRILNIDWSKGTMQNGDDFQYQDNIVNRFLPTIGAGVYYDGERSYVGLSVPNFLVDERYDGTKEGLADERMHFYLIGGLVFDLSANTKFKPAFLLKYVSGAPVVADLSANFMFYDKFRIGASYRTGDSVSGLVGFQLTQSILIGYAYDYTTTELQQFTSGSHEIMLRFELKSKEEGLKSPRFF